MTWIRVRLRRGGEETMGRRGGLYPRRERYRRRKIDTPVPYMHGRGEDLRRLCPRDAAHHRRLYVLWRSVAPSRVIVGHGRGNGRSCGAPPEGPGQGAPEGGGVEDDEAPRRGAGRGELLGDALVHDAQHRCGRRAGARRRHRRGRLVAERASCNNTGSRRVLPQFPTKC